MIRDDSSAPLYTCDIILPITSHWIKRSRRDPVKDSLQYIIQGTVSSTLGVMASTKSRMREVVSIEANSSYGNMTYHLEKAIHLGLFAQMHGSSIFVSILEEVIQQWRRLELSTMYNCPMDR